MPDPAAITAPCQFMRRLLTMGREAAQRTLSPPAQGCGLSIAQLYAAYACLHSCYDSRGQKSEVRNQKSEVRSQKSEVRSQKSEEGYASTITNACAAPASRHMPPARKLPTARFAGWGLGRTKLSAVSYRLSAGMGHESPNHRQARAAPAGCPLGAACATSLEAATSIFCRVGLGGAQLRPSGGAGGRSPPACSPGVSRAQIIPKGARGRLSYEY
jgi:hypothetical protein